MIKPTLLFFSLLLSIAGYSQTDSANYSKGSLPTVLRTITGYVYDQGEPLVGCTVMLEGSTTIGAVTDLDGRYILKIPADTPSPRLRVSFIGYNTVYVDVSKHTNTYNVRMGEGTYRDRYLMIKRNTAAEIDPYTVKDVRVRLLRNYNSSADGFMSRKKMELLTQSIKVKSDKHGYIYLKSVTDADRLQDVETQETVLVGEVADSVLRVYPAPIFSHLMTSRKDTLGVLYMTNDMHRSYMGISLDKIKNIVDKGDDGFVIQGASGKYKTYKQIVFSSYINVGTVGKLPELSSPYSQEGTDEFFRTGVSFGNYIKARMGAFGSSILALNLGQNRNNSTISNAYKESYDASVALEKMKLGIFESEAGVSFKSSYGRLTQQGANLSSLLSCAYENNQGDMNAQRPDRNKTSDLMAYLKTTGKYRRIIMNADVSYDKQWDKKHSGTLESAVFPDRLSYRNMQASNIMARTGVDWRIKNFINGYLSYGFKHTAESVNREDYYKDPDTSYDSEEHNKPYRNAHDIRYGIRIQPRWELTLEAFNNHYFSNTAKSSDYVNLFPELGVSWSMERFFDRVFDFDRQFFTLYGSIKRSVGEAALISRNPAVLSTAVNSQDFRRYYEYAEVYQPEGLKPETYLKSEIGLRYSSPYGKFRGEANFFNYQTQNYTAPVVASGQAPTLENIGRLRNYGYFLSVTYKSLDGYYEPRMEVSLSFSQTRNKVTAVYGDKAWLPLAGFADVQTVFAEDQPLGAIYASTATGDDKVMIGDPTPDFILSLHPTFRWRDFSLSFALEYSHGGDRWNGTQAILDQGDRLENEAYIQDASFLRLSNMAFSYHIFKNRNHLFVKSMSVKAQTNNLFVVSPYKGVDPSSLLFGYASGYGLDLFNLPSMRRYSLSLTLEF